jgi:hypothetical protein
MISGMKYWVFGWRYDIRNEVLGVVHHLLQASFINASD